jgi:hypothetical protein
MLGQRPRSGGVGAQKKMSDMPALEFPESALWSTNFIDLDAEEEEEERRRFIDLDTEEEEEGPLVVIP